MGSFKPTPLPTPIPAAQAYLASGTEDSEGSSGSEDAGDAEDAEAVKARYRALLLGGGQEEAGAVAGAKKDGATSDKGAGRGCLVVVVGCHCSGRNPFHVYARLDA